MHESGFGIVAKTTPVPDWRSFIDRGVFSLVHSHPDGLVVQRQEIITISQPKNSIPTKTNQFQGNSEPEMKPLLTAEQLAAALQLKRTTVLEMARQGVIPVTRLSRKAVRFDAEMVQRALDSRTTAGCASN